ncbi:MAG TPA: adenylosuccinate lyase [Candidatus Omnitrophota bacterium]|nr:adenylosuccinate lyase [Candidatus Omnitrophota bacterium]
MIERYSLPRMSAIWQDQNKFRIMLDIELLVCEAQAKLKLIPASAVRRIKANANFRVERIKEIEESTQHDIVAFVANVSEYIGKDAQYLHMGLTSSDLLDTTLDVQLVQASDLLIYDLKRLSMLLAARAKKYKNTVCIGRTHGVHAEPTTFGLKLALWYDEVNRSIKRMKAAQKEISYGKLSGAVGTYSNIDPAVEEYVCKKLGLQPVNIATQVIQRDIYAQYLCSLAVIASSLDKFALEIRHLQRTEVLEAEEPFARGQKGSSAMPHKRNPVICERICGLARLLRANATAGLENVALWHERDISHSSVERVIGPDATTILDFALKRITGLIEGLVVYPENIQRNLELTKGLWHSQNVLLALVEAGIARDTAYAWVQRNALPVWEGKKTFKELLLKDKDVVNTLGQKQVEELFDLTHHLAHVDTIFERVFQ